VVETHATGIGDIIEGRVDVAREKALEDALRRAVEQAAGALLSSKTMVENGMVLQDRIFKNARGFVQSFQILSEGVDATGYLYSVDVVAFVVRTGLEQSLREVIAQMGGVRTLVVLEGNEVFRSRLVSSLVESGIDVLDPEAMQDLLDRQKVVLAEQSLENAQSAGLWFFSRFVLRGSARETEVGQIEVSGVSLVTAGISFSVDLLDVTRGQVVQSFSGVKSGSGGSAAMAFSRALDQAMQDVEGKVPRAILNFLSDSSPVQLVAQDLPSIREILDQVPGISGVQQGETVGNQVRFHFQYRGKMDTLANRLREFGLQVEVVGQSFFCSLRMVEIRVEGVSFQELLALRERWDVEILFSSGVARFSLPGDAMEIAVQLEGMGFAVQELGASNVVATKR